MLSNNFTDLKSAWTQKYGLYFTEEGLVLPSQKTDVLDQKIVKSLSEVRKRIIEAIASGKYVIYLPGSYDLVHIGHLSFLEQCTLFSVENIRKKQPNVGRENLFIVALADSDKLIKEVKKYKHTSYGGEETFFRPVEYEFDKTKRHPRLDALASLPVDCVCFLPSPNDDRNLLPSPTRLDITKIDSLLQKISLTSATISIIKKAVYDYMEFCKLSDKYLINLTDPNFIVLWQLYLNLFLNPLQTLYPKIPQAFEKGKITRILSIHDNNYAEIVKALMLICNIAILEINDQILLSTSQLLKEYGPKKVLQSKEKAILEINEK